MVLSQLRENEWYVGGDKCLFISEETQFFGLIVKEGDMKIRDDRFSVNKERKSLQALQNFVVSFGCYSFSTLYQELIASGSLAHKFNQELQRW